MTSLWVCSSQVVQMKRSEGLTRMLHSASSLRKRVAIGGISPLPVRHTTINVLSTPNIDFSLDLRHFVSTYQQFFSEQQHQLFTMSSSRTCRPYHSPMPSTTLSRTKTSRFRQSQLAFSSLSTFYSMYKQQHHSDDSSLRSLRLRHPSCHYSSRRS